ncbi:MAG: dicarboxylate/amino acid:cation symporter, partial [Burkholderiales bacterium]|nr:dicarboxylate/amino acid:cation symporter [Burkholderiales bacterium]
PLTFSTIVASFAKYEDFTTMKKIGGNTLFWFVLTAFFAGIVGIIVGVSSHIGFGLSIQNDITSQLASNTPSIRNTFLDMIPSNIIAEIAKDKIIPVILFAIFFGLALSSLGDGGKTVRLFFSEFSEVMFKITRVIIKLSPIGIFVLMAEFSNKYGFESLIPLAQFIVMMYVACVIQIIVYLILLMVFARKSPIDFIRGFLPAMITAFSTSSSMGTLPVTMERLVGNLGVRSDIAGFVAPLGANMKMDACGAIFPAMVCILTANLLHIDLTIVQYILIFFLSVIATFCTVGMPGTALMSATFVLVGMGFPLDGLAIVLGVDRIVDMMRTMTNVTGTGTCAVLVDRTTKSK